MRVCIETHGQNDWQTHLLERLNGTITEVVKLSDIYKQPLTVTALAKWDRLICNTDYEDEMFEHAKLFREAKQIVVAVPYWCIFTSSFIYSVSLRIF